MKNPRSASLLGRVLRARPGFPRGFVALLAGCLAVSLPVVVGRAQPADESEPEGEVLTRGPVHEAFAGVVSYNPEPGVIVAKPPPEPIEEIPPEEKPEGNDVVWIPGYWAWDDEREDYLWISGIWRAVPPGREWIAGYWRDTGQGYQWISGYWADADAPETTYLPPPPATLEVGANIDAPSEDYGWTPGCWIWRDDRYAWRAGYWTQGRADWVWVPACYVWTPRGVIFVEGFWDYPLERRGLLFAPIYYQSRGYARRGYSYTPRIVISLSFFSDNLFLRPSYHHYYFGDYYGPRYEQGGFCASFSFQSGRRGYDPFYVHDRWTHRAERDWEHRYRAAYQYRRDHEAARPPRTWAAQVTINARPAPAGQIRVVTASPLSQLTRSRDNPGRFQAVPPRDRQQFAQRGREVQQSRDSRQSVESGAAVTMGRNGGRMDAPARMPVSQPPIVVRPAVPRTEDPVPPPRPPARNESSGRRSDPDRRNPAETRPVGRNAPGERWAPEPARETSPRFAPAAPRPAPPGERVREPDARNRNEVPRRETAPPSRVQPGDDRRVQPAPARPMPAERSKPAEKGKPDDDGYDRNKDRDKLR